MDLELDLNFNIVVLAGEVTVSPELRDFESGSRMARILVTVRSRSPRRRVDVVPVTYWDPPAEVADLAAGTRVWVVASVQRRFWEGAEGRRSRLEIVARHVQRKTDDVGDGPALHAVPIAP